MSSANVIALPSVKERQRALSELLALAIQHSFPMYTYKELKGLLRCEYHRFVMELREHKTWDEISALTGMSRAGLNKLGDEPVPATHHNAVRRLWAVIAAAGESGIAIGPLAAAFYERDDGLEGPDLRECVHCLVESGYVTRREGRYVILQNQDTEKGREEFLTSAVATMEAIANRVIQNDWSQEERVNRASLVICADPDAYINFYDRIKMAVLDIIAETENAADVSDGPTTTMTLVIGGSPNV